MEPTIRIRALERGDIREGFSCGEPLLDLFLREYAGQNQFRHHIAVTYVAVEESSRRVCGYVTVSGATLEPGSAQDLPPVPYAQVPVLRVARLGVDRAMQGHGLGSELVEYILRLALEQARRVGCAGALVDAKPSACEYYESLGFRPCGIVEGQASARPRPVAMFLSTRRIEAALQP